MLWSEILLVLEFRNAGNTWPMSYWKHGFWVLIERCFKQTAKYVDYSIKLSPCRQLCCPLSLIYALSFANIPDRKVIVLLNSWHISSLFAWNKVRWELKIHVSHRSCLNDCAKSVSLRHVVILATLTVLIRYQHRWSHLQTMSVGIKILRQLFCLTEISTTPPIIASLVQ